MLRTVKRVVKEGAPGEAAAMRFTEKGIGTAHPKPHAMPQQIFREN